MSRLNPRPNIRVAFIHTVAVLIESFRDLAAQHLPDIETFHILNESLLQDLLKTGASPAITRRIVQQALVAADAGVDLLVFTCSSTSPAIDAARQLTSVPVIKVDDPMAAKAAELGGRVAVLCTTQSTVIPSTELIESHGRALGRTVTALPNLVDGAFDALRAGDRDRHDALVKEAALEVSQKADAVVLAQASLAHLHEPLAGTLAIPVLSSPPLLMENLRQRVEQLRG